MAKETVKHTTGKADPIATFAADLVRQASEAGETGILVQLPLALIDAKSFKNQRTGDFTKGASKEDGTDQSFEELFESIELTGQKDPITVRPKKPGQVTNGMPFEVVKGFRRYAAVSGVAQKTGAEEPTIKAIVKLLDDHAALEENVYENTARDNLTGPDLAWAAYNLQESFKARGEPISDNQLAKRMGKNQSYISKIKKIVATAPVIAKAWQESQAPLTVDAMVRIAEMAPEKQEAEYARINKLMGGRGNLRNGGGARPPIDTATRQAEKVASLLGNLASQGLIKVDIDWNADLKHLGVKTDDLTVQDTRTVGKLAREAFEKAAAPKSEPRA